MTPELKEYLLTSFGQEWFDLLEKDFETTWFMGIAHKLSEERTKKMVYPTSENVFRAFRETPFSQVKVIILGQDPYNGPNEANGIPFDCSQVASRYICGSWKKVLEEYDREFPSNFATDLMAGDLLRWCHSGILLLNSALTVPHKDPGAHQKIWSPFTARIIDILAWSTSPKVFVFLGNDAKKFAHMVRNPHISFQFEHPAAALYGNATRPWAADRIFRNINAALEQLGQQPIEW